MKANDQAVVVPLAPMEPDPSTEVMLRMLLNREAILIQRTAAPTEVAASGMFAQASGSFAKSISHAVGHSVQAASSNDLYRVVLPTGSVARDLVPAVGGGFRGLVRASGSTKISGQAKLFPAAAGAGATVAAGPLIATVGLALAGEMLAQHQTNKKLAAINSAVRGIQQRINDDDRSTLTTAAKQAETVISYFLDQAQIPSISSAAHAFGQLDSLTNAHIERLDRWLNVAEDYRGADRVNASKLMGALVGKHNNQVQEFERAVAQTYEALALRARIVVIEKVAAEFSNEGRSLPHVESVLHSELSALANRQSQLVGLMEDLNVLNIDAGRGPVVVAGKGTIHARTSFGRLARALHASPDSLPLLTDSEQTVLELQPSAEGLSVVSPGLGGQNGS